LGISKPSKHRPLVSNGRLVLSVAIAAILLLTLPCAALAYPWKWEQGMMYSSTPGVNCNCEGIYSCNTVQNDACHAYCEIKHANAIYVYDDYSIGQDQWAEMGWMWAKEWPHPRWYVDRMTSYGESFWLLGETAQGVNHIIKIYKTGGTNWNYTFTAYVDNTAILSVTGNTVSWGWSVVSGEKWDDYGTNWSDWWGLRAKGYPGVNGNWRDWVGNIRWRGNDPRYIYKVLSKTSGQIRNR
jgi:hypothetical protein